MTNHLYDTIFAGHETSTKAFLIDERGEVSYQAFLQRVNQLANALKASGLKDGDRVAVQAQKSKAQLALYVATIKAGGVYLPLNTAYTAHELDYFIHNAAASIIVVDSKAEDKLREIALREQACR